MAPIMLTIHANTGNLILRTFFLIVVAVMGYILLAYGLHSPDNEKIIWWKLKAIHIFYVLLCTLLYLVATIVASLLGITRVEVDTKTEIIIFKGFISKKTISTNEIDHYFWTVHRNQFKVFYGILLILKDNRTIQLAGQNLKSIPDLKEYLIGKGIPDSGLRKMKFPFN